MRRVGDGGHRVRTEDFENFYRTHYPRVRSFVARRVSPHDVDDVLVDTFWAAARRYDEIPAARDRQTGWLLVTARNMINNLHRANGRVRLLSDRLRSLAPTTPPDDDAPITEGWSDARIGRAFDALSSDDRTILLLAAWDGCTPGELAEFFDCTPGAAKTRLSRAKGRFKQAVERGAGDA